MTQHKILEKDMYPILKDFFETKGYKVNAEVKDCDIVITKDDYLAVVEMKLKLNITLVHQALKRLDITNNVFMAVQRPKKQHLKEKNKMKKLARRLNIGLIFVDPLSINNSIEIVVEPTEESKPKNTKKTRAIQKEIEGRRFDSNMGGVTNTEVLTAYRDMNIKLACICETYTVISPKFLKENFGIEKTYPILYNNFYKYFVMFGKGDFGLSDEGQEMLNSNKYIDLVSIYRKEVQEKLNSDIKNN